MKRGIAVVAAMLVLMGCNTARPFVVSADPNDTVEVKASAALRDGSPYMKSVDGVVVKPDYSTVILPPGMHTFVVHCRVSGGGFGGLASVLGRLALGTDRTFTFDLQAGHEYRFDNDTPPHLEDGCISYLYDGSDGRDAYSEAARIPGTEKKAGKWHDFASLQFAGHEVVEKLPLDQYEAQQRHIGTLFPETAYQRQGWTQMLETESWEKLTFPKTADADAAYQNLVAGLQTACPQAVATALAESTDDVTFEIDLPAGCDGAGVRARIGRIMTAKYEILSAVLVSRLPLTLADKDRWLGLLKTAYVDEDN